MTLHLDNGAVVGEMTLQNDNTFRGPIRFKHHRATTAQFNVSAALR